jgi:hypothetical protein
MFFERCSEVSIVTAHAAVTLVNTEGHARTNDVNKRHLKLHVLPYKGIEGRLNVS